MISGHRIGITMSVALLLPLFLATPATADFPVDANAEIDPNTGNSVECTTHAGPVIVSAEITATGDNPTVIARVSGEGPLGSEDDSDQDSGASHASASVSIVGFWTRSEAETSVAWGGGGEAEVKCGAEFRVTL